MKTADKAKHIEYKRVKSTRIGLKKTESNKALPAVGIVNDRTVVNL